METINIQLKVPNTGQYTLDEFVDKIKLYAEKLTSSFSSPKGDSMTNEEQEAYVAESLYRALDEMESHQKDGSKPTLAIDFLKELEEEEN